jgi:hypothetical protein
MFKGSLKFTFCYQKENARRGVIIVISLLLKKKEVLEFSPEWNLIKIQEINILRKQIITKPDDAGETCSLSIRWQCFEYYIIAFCTALMI